MITLLHGDDILASRTELARLKEGLMGREVRLLDGRKIDQVALIQALESSSLFANGLLVVIENLLGSFGRKTKSADTLVSLLINSSKTTDIILWEEKEVSKTTLDKLNKSATVKLFKIPAIIFQFLDGLRPGATAQLIGLFESIIQSQPSEVVHALLVRRVRQLMMLKDGAMPVGLISWQAGRLTNQTKLFTMEKLVSMHKSLLLAEYSLKTGASPFSMPQLLEQFLVDL